MSQNNELELSHFSPIKRLPDETPRAFMAFLEFAFLNEEERSLPLLSKKLGVSVYTMERWSSQNNWHDRVHQYTEHLASIELKAQEAVMTTQAVDWAKRQEEHR